MVLLRIPSASFSLTAMQPLVTCIRPSLPIESQLTRKRQVPCSDIPYREARKALAASWFWRRLGPKLSVSHYPLRPCCSSLATSSFFVTAITLLVKQLLQAITHFGAHCAYVSRSFLLVSIDTHISPGDYRMVQMRRAPNCFSPASRRRNRRGHTSTCVRIPFARGTLRPLRLFIL